MILTRKFYNQKTLKVAQDLLGCFLVRQIGKRIVKGIIAETEAYCGPKDKANHASRGRTLRTEVMFGPSGHAYIYLIYGMYYCFNVVTEKENYPAAVLIRGVWLFNSLPIRALAKHDDLRCSAFINGPGKVCQHFQIDKKLNNWDLTQGQKLWIESNPCFKKENYKIIRTSRVGVNYAKEYKDKKWRFVLKTNFHVDLAA